MSTSWKTKNSEFRPVILQNFSPFGFVCNFVLIRFRAGFFLSHFCLESCAFCVLLRVSHLEVHDVCWWYLFLSLGWLLANLCTIPFLFFVLLLPSDLWGVYVNILFLKLRQLSLITLNLNSVVWHRGSRQCSWTDSPGAREHLTGLFCHMVAHFLTGCWAPGTVRVLDGSAADAGHCVPPSTGHEMMLS